MMNLLHWKYQRWNRWLGFGAAVCILLLTIYLSNLLVNQLKTEEQKKVENIVKALELQSLDQEISDKTQQLTLKITQDNNTIPLILIDEDGAFVHQKNLDHLENLFETDSTYLHNYLKNRITQSPIEVELPFGNQYIYYQNSSLLTQLQFYPALIVLILLLFTLFTIWYFRTLNNTQKSYLWAGMAKETAHQIGTPLSSLLGWTELLKMEEVDPEIIVEMEEDLERLKQIAERFSKIGSVPDLQPTDLVQVCENTYLYLQKRISSHVQFDLHTKPESAMIMGNEQLLSWVLENLVRNAVDAMQNRGRIQIILEENSTKYRIYVIDNGPGIPKSMQKRIFEPGYTTKKRGWGLGLSLAKRIIKEYHSGKIVVSKSEKNLGTTFKLEFQKL
ncbi:MAG: HAMP domain-containing sensor histidine kinase [Weeksellaceae bacterium]|nr:HAMP domain-containing sensor histidine kinase [Weeksellaceae bacterium]